MSVASRRQLATSPSRAPLEDGLEVTALGREVEVALSRRNLREQVAPAPSNDLLGLWRRDEAGQRLAARYVRQRSSFTHRGSVRTPRAGRSSWHSNSSRGPTTACLALRSATPSLRGQKCDLVLEGEWAVEVKMLRCLGDNGKPNDNILMHILSPYPAHRSALTDCMKLRDSGFAERLPA